MLKDRIKELRTQNNLTISAFAKSLGISPTSASLYESGKQNPGKKTVAKICDVYGVDEAWLMEDAPVVTVPETKIIGDITKEADEPAVAPGDEKSVAEKKKSKKKDTDKADIKKEPDIPAILARVAEIGVRKAAAEAGVAWQTVTKWKKDAEKAAAIPTPTEIEEEVAESIKEAVDSITEGEELTTPNDLKEGLEVIAEVMEEMIPPAKEEKIPAPTPTTEHKVAAPVEEKKDQIDITAVLSRVAEIGVRKAAAEAGVAWQTVTKWKKDAEKAAAALPTSEEIQKAVDKLATPKGAQEAVTTPAEPAEVKGTAAPAEEKKDQIDISAVLARVAEIGVRKAAAEIGVAWQTVSKWKKDAAATQTAPISSIQEKKKEEKKQEKKQPEENDDVVDAEENKTTIIIQSPLGGNITPGQILKMIPAGCDSVYVRVDENKLYWVKGDENGAVDIWG